MKTFLVVVCNMYILLSQSQGVAQDSLKTYSLKERVITATRSRIASNDSPVRVDVLSAEDIRRTNGSTVADVLQNNANIFLKEYGANGALRTLSLRGSASEQTLILVNGNRLNTFQNGLVDLSLLPLNDIERIEIVHGGASALYGADALGGVVNIITRIPPANMSVRTEAAVGSFGLEKYLIETGGSAGDVGILAGVSSERGRDDYPFLVHRFGIGDTMYSRENSDYVKRQMYAHGNALFGERSTLNYSAQYVIADRGAAGPFDPSYPSLARQHDDDGIFSLGYTRETEALVLNLNGSFHYGLENYDAPDPFFPYSTFYKNIYLSLNPQARMVVSPNQTLVVGGELAQGTLEGPDFDSKITRVQKALYVSSESNFDFSNSALQRISLYQTLRYDHISDVEYAITPKFGINVRLSQEGDVSFKASIGRNFRTPSFNDLYYRGFSNPLLTSERSTSFDVGIRYSSSNENSHTFEITYFNLNTDNRIVVDPNTFTPFNVGKVLSTGIEMKYDEQLLNKLLKFGVQYSFTDARKKNLDYATDSTYDKQIISLPNQTFNLNVSLHLQPVTLNVYYVLVGARYTTADNSISLPSYSIIKANVLIRKQLGDWNVMLKGEVNNLFDAQHEVFAKYPMPGRNYRLTFGVEY